MKPPRKQGISSMCHRCRERLKFKTSQYAITIPYCPKCGDIPVSWMQTEYQAQRLKNLITRD